jgi:uncharacterized protein YjiK
MINKINFFLVPLVIILIISCKTDDDKGSNSDEVLRFSIAETIPVAEPSGLDLSFDETGFWVVSDNNSTVYLIDSWGKSIKSFKVDGEDLEGITVVDSVTLAVVLERTREVVILDTSGKELNRTKLNLKGDLNSGLEGITFDQADRKFYLLNEKDPVLLLTLDENLNELSRDTIKYLKDASGIYYDVSEKQLWILSDENKMIVKTNINGDVIEKFKIRITQPEGITLKSDKSQLFIVSDVTGSLYVYNLE